MFEHRVAGAVRLTLLIVGSILVVLLVAPLQWLSRRRGWRLGRVIPILYCRSLCWCLNVRPHFHGAPASGPLMLVPNHVSWLDIPAIGCGGPVAFIAKREVAGWPIFGALAKLQGAIFIDRSRRRHILATNARVAERMLRGETVVLFAEGTTGCGSRVKTFHTSHFEAAKIAATLGPAPTRTKVQPVSIAYTRRNGIPLSRHDRPAIAWYGDMTLLPHLWGMVTGGPIDCDIRFAEPIDICPTSNRKVVGRQAERTVRHATSMALTGRPFRPTTTRPDPRPVLIGAERS